MMRRSDDSPPITPESPTETDIEPADPAAPTEQAESEAPIEPATQPTPPEPESIAVPSSEPVSTKAPSAEAPEDTTPPAECNPPPEFIHLPLGRIIVEEQIRTGIDRKGESFQALMESIRQKGVLEPVLVARRDERFLPISGERRFLACRQLGLEKIPSRVLDAVVSQEEILAIQLIENLQRENLNPIDEANAYFAFFRGSQTGVEPDGIINTIMNYSRDPERVKNEFTAQLAVIIKYSGKSITFIRRILSLLRLPEEIQQAIREEKIGLSQGYLFAENINHPALMEIFNSFLEKPLTYNALKMLFRMTSKTGKAKVGRKPQPIRTLRTKMKTVRAMIEDRIAKVKISDLADLLADIESLRLFLKEELERLAAPAPGKDDDKTE
jgi:ParB family chromosome partitioning protein